MKTLNINLYRFAELRDKVQRKVIDDLLFINVDTGWWQFIYEDAKNVGFIISGFDIDRDFTVNGRFEINALTTANAVLLSHGKLTSTYQSANAYLRKCADMAREWPRSSPAQPLPNAQLNEAFEDLAAGFLNDLKHQYLLLLVAEYEHLISDQTVRETIKANDYWFTATGKQVEEPELLTALIEQPWKRL